MRAAVMRDWQLRVDELPDPTPGPGQVLTKVLACGICGSDLHLLQHGEESRRLMNELNADRPPDPMQLKMFEPELDTVMGHEFCCEVVDLGAGCSNLKVGDIVVSLPVAFDAAGLHAVGFSNIYNGGYAELMVLNEMVGIKVPRRLRCRHRRDDRAARGRRACRRQEPDHRATRAPSCSAAGRSAWRASPN